MEVEERGEVRTRKIDGEHWVWANYIVHIAIENRFSLSHVFIVDSLNIWWEQTLHVDTLHALIKIYLCLFYSERCCDLIFVPIFFFASSFWFPKIAREIVR